MLSPVLMAPGCLESPAAHTVLQVSRAGIRGLTADDEDAHQLPALEVDDPRQARRQLAADLASPTAREAFLDSLGEVLAAEELLHKCLLPITVCVQVRECSVTTAIAV